MSTAYIIISGTFQNGFAAHGPFKTIDEAFQAANTNSTELSGVSYEIVELLSLDEPD